ncbi:MAG: nucleoside deaminase [Planctomycetaceae bacterium]|nr:nucleoside deaminase [Planctomycetaceae bacterium]
MSPQDEEFLREAIRLSSEQMLAEEGGPFGAVVVREGRIIGRGWNRVTSTNDPTAHAEIIAIREACAESGSFHLSGATIYSSCEPCPMCLCAILWARLDRIVYAASRHDAAAAGFDDQAFYDEISRAPHERSVASEQGLREESLAALRAWVQKPDRLDY